MKNKKDNINFGKKDDNTYRIIERIYKDNSIIFLVEITSNFDSTFIDFDNVEFYGQTFSNLDDAKTCVVELKNEDKKNTILEDKIHDL